MLGGGAGGYLCGSRPTRLVERLPEDAYRPIDSGGLAPGVVEIHEFGAFYLEAEDN
jgi:hypothetical protein